MEVLFTEEDHKYTHSSGKIYTSVTTVIGKYKAKFDTEYWSTYKAIERILGDEEFKKIKRKLGFENIIPVLYGKYYKQIPPVKEKILAEWAEKTRLACEKGTAFHKEQENNTNSGSVCVETNLPIQIGNRDLKDIQDGVYAEMVLWINEYGIAGQADKVIIEGKYIDIDDYKTSQYINITSFKHHTKGYEMMLYPIDNIMNCNLYHYSLQLSIYGYMLECHGKIVRNLRIYHQGTDKWISVKYLREEVIALLQHYKQSL